MNTLIDLLTNFVDLFVESAPWLILGLLVAGIMHELVPIDFLKKHMGSNSYSAIGKAAVIGAPLPLCSCGVIPAALGLRRSGASKSSTVSFLVATPETGVDSVSVSYALLGPIFAVFRPIAAILSAIYTGVLVKLFGQESSALNSDAKFNKSTEVKSCCSSKKEPEPQSCCGSKSEQVEVTTSCCSSNEKVEETSCCSAEQPVAKTPSWSTKTIEVLQFASGKLLIDITLWLLIGLAMAAVIKTFVPVDFLTQWGDGIVAMLLMAVIGIPMYICATASTPIAVGFLIAGLSPGAVLVFLLAGPATNISTMGMIGKEMGARTLWLYLFGVISSAIFLGYGLNYLYDYLQMFAAPFHFDNHEHSSTQWIYYACATLLAALMLRNTVKKYWPETNSGTVEMR
ncbi:SO_0444 family Cu/Zn efflux transporter [Glaciecola sp. 1036]|uniref:SO_0444 family Cu/Zn efflux transporter n=1 Tax=Alteromonadaceae TaxID=72275 RepID=UPI003CFE5C25